MGRVPNDVTMRLCVMSNEPHTRSLSVLLIYLS